MSATVIPFPTTVLRRSYPARIRAAIVVGAISVCVAFYAALMAGAIALLG